ncbi:TfoX/Sxy family protein [Sphingosinithalassobacter sp. LHW66-3]|uniref:TfoX/Sxy family protein n=1 Tax=Sphingosinithalassobacter sp. LHW66-3 TaxID=3424718 RepID=UPI003D6B7FFE
MAVDEGLVEWVREALAPIGSVSMRRMMGGATLYCDGTIFAIVGDGELWFKADGESDAIWDAEACPRFTYAMGVGRTGSMNYRRAPDAVYDDADVMRRWAAVAIEAGLRAPKRKPRSRPR